MNIKISKRSIIYLLITMAGTTFGHIARAQSPLTPQTAEYQVNYGSIELGTAKYNLSPVNEAGIYQYHFNSNLSLLLLSDERNITSEFKLDENNNNQLLPLRYKQDRKGTGSDYMEQTAFARQQGKIYTRYKNQRNDFDYGKEIFDPLVIQLQLRLDLADHRETLEYSMIKSNKLDTYKFKIMGKEKIQLPSGSYDTIKLEVIRKSKKRQTFFWLAPDLSYLPVRLAHYKKGSKQLDIKLLNYQFSPLQTKLSTAE